MATKKMTNDNISGFNCVFSKASSAVITSRKDSMYLKNCSIVYGNLHSTNKASARHHIVVAFYQNIASWRNYFK